jgi:hypothetical protein
MLSRWQTQVEAILILRNLIFSVIFLALAGAASAQTYTNIQDRTDGASCSTCAGSGGTGTKAIYWIKQNVSSPSLSGQAAQLFLGGSTPYSDALWNWRIASDSSKMRHYVYDVDYYVKTPSAVQGLEFNITSYDHGRGYTYGFTCSVKSGGVWKISVPDDSTSSMAEMHWSSTGIACPTPPAYKWNHVNFEAERTSSGMIHYISLTVNGTKHYINKTVYARKAPSDWNGLTTHVQLNGDSKQTDYSVWIDRYKVTVDGSSSSSDSGSGSGSTSSSCSTPSSTGINVCSPGSTSSSTVAVKAMAKLSSAIYRFELWADGVKKATIRDSGTMSTTISLSKGTHKLEFVAYNSSGSSRTTKTISTTVQ